MKEKDWYPAARAEHLCCWGYGVWEKRSDKPSDNLIAECDEDAVHLLAASTDMYQALEDLVAYCMDGYGDFEADEIMNSKLALAKARGENNDSK